MRHTVLARLLTVVTLAGAVGSPMAPAAAADDASPNPELAAIEATARDYIEGWFDGDEERMERAL